MRASTFKTRRLKVIDRARATVESVPVSKQGTPRAKTILVESQGSDIFGFMAGEFLIVGDIESPLVPLNQRKIPQK